MGGEKEKQPCSTLTFPPLPNTYSVPHGPVWDERTRTAGGVKAGAKTFDVCLRAVCTLHMFGGVQVFPGRAQTSSPPFIHRNTELRHTEPW